MISPAIKGAKALSFGGVFWDTAPRHRLEIAAIAIEKSRHGGVGTDKDLVLCHGGRGLDRGCIG
jgi:hypothetical protein